MLALAAAVAEALLCSTTVTETLELVVADPDEDPDKTSVLLSDPEFVADSLLEPARFVC